jgi:hypothetical protein
VNKLVVTSGHHGGGDSKLFHSHNTNNLIVYAICASANRGLFAGLVVMVLTAVKCICVSQQSEGEEEKDHQSSLLHTMTVYNTIRLIIRNVQSTNA